MILASDEASTSAKKAAMASIGRKRDINNKWALLHYSEHNNPEVALQAIRGLAWGMRCGGLAFQHIGQFAIKQDVVGVFAGYE